MIIDLSKAKVGDIKTFSFKISLPDEYLTRVGSFDGEAEVKADVVLVGEAEAAVTGEVKYGLTTPCDKCGDECKKVYKARLSASFSGEPDEDGYFFNGIELDLSKAVADSVILDLPTKVLCSDDCLGVCPTCGQNLNKGACKCKESKVDDSNPFALLRQIDFSSGGADNGSTKG